MHCATHLIHQIDYDFYSLKILFQTCRKVSSLEPRHNQSSYQYLKRQALQQRPAQLLSGKILNLHQRGLCFAKENKVFTAADSQSSSQIGDIGRYKDMDFIFPTEYEARISLRNQDDGIVVLSQKLAELTSAKNIILKLGSEGALLHFDDGGKANKTDRLAPINISPKDVAGAGDSMLISTMMSYVAGANAWEAACIGGLASAIQISRLGNLPLQSKELLDCLK